MAKETHAINETRKLLLKNLKDTPKSILKSKLIDDYIRSQNLSKAELADRKPGGIINKLSCRFYTAIQQLTDAGCISVDESGHVKFIKDEEPEEVDRAIEIEELLRSVTAKNAYNKETLLNKVSNKYFENYPQAPKDKDFQNAIRGDAGNILKKLVDDKIIPKEGDLYGNKEQVLSKRERNKADIAAMKSNTYLFVSHTVSMLSSFMQKCCKYENIQSEIIDGTQKDDGVDGLLSYDDKFGKSVKVIIQVKHRDNSKKENKQESVNVVREFGGVLASKQDILQGIFVTTISYSEKAKKFANDYKSKYLLLINGELWLDLADKCNYVISENL